MVGDYLANQPEITVQMRCILIDWLVEVRSNVWDWDWGVIGPSKSRPQGRHWPLKGVQAPGASFAP